jgi:hypothetical protein
MRRSYLIFLILFLTVTSGLANEELNEKVELTKKEYLQFVIGSYVWGFNEFDTNINIYPNLIKISIYYNIEERNVILRNSLKREFELRIRNLIQHISWAKDYKIDVSVHSKARRNRWY